MDYARKLKAEREKQGLTQRQAAQKWGINLATLRAWEQGISKPRGLYAAHFRKLFPDAGTEPTGKPTRQRQQK